MEVPSIFLSDPELRKEYESAIQTMSRLMSDKASDDDNLAQSHAIVDKFLTSTYSNHNPESRLIEARTSLISTAVHPPAPKAQPLLPRYVPQNEAIQELAASLSASSNRVSALKSTWSRTEPGQSRAFPQATFDKACSTDDLTKVVSRGTNTAAGGTTSRAIQFTGHKHLTDTRPLTGHSRPERSISASRSKEAASNTPLDTVSSFREAYSARRASLDMTKSQRPHSVGLSASSMDARANLHRLNALTSTLSTYG
ncbi:hypothetical protein J8273_1422 [Carpediemonas membranifera]|uniref:Uncharacterized protein n=1 Tax=Carpediemonas membranifera TaxID=201153 RepID=A0A8J6B2L4_9EUKA|nr:hypothetical protein J8273_1422 [Carpediemonas membranifera]|eukprot:KAG9397065.1 hypothetical protein J8273_1422 [Carpediemonas membranifera]